MNILRTARNPPLADNQISLPLRRRRFMRPQAILAIGFLLMIILGTLLLMMPFSVNSGAWDSLSTASFTAVSSVCITGLTVVDLNAHYSHTGLVIILVLVQLGGLGIMSIGSFLLLLVGGKISTQGESTMMVTYGTRTGDVRRIVRHAVEFVFLFEAIGALVLFWRYLHYGWAAPQAAWHAVFHTVCAFCNAGFSLYPESLAAFKSDPIYLTCVMVMMVFGGLGFLVLTNLFSVKFWRRDLRTRGRLTLHSRVVLKMAFVLILAGAAAFAALEWKNLLAGESLTDAIGISFFSAITPRTAGYSVVPMHLATQPTTFITSMLMFIGGSPGSMAGGLKTTTLVVLFLTVRAMVKGRAEVELDDRTIPFSIVREATSIFVFYVMMIAAACFALLLVEPALAAENESGLIFETISAYTTTGLSLEITHRLSAAGRAIIAFGMFAGRLGPITLALVIGSRVVTQYTRYPEEEITVG